MTTRAIQKVFKKYAAKAGLSSHFSIHCLRHTYACFLLKASKGNLRLVQKQLGHSKITTTQIYADGMMPEMKAAVNKFYLAIADDLVSRDREAVTHQVSQELIEKSCQPRLRIA